MRPKRPKQLSKVWVLLKAWSFFDTHTHTTVSAFVQFLIKPLPFWLPRRLILTVTNTSIKTILVLPVKRKHWNWDGEVEKIQAVRLRIEPGASFFFNYHFVLKNMFMSARKNWLKWSLSALRNVHFCTKYNIHMQLIKSLHHRWAFFNFGKIAWLTNAGPKSFAVVHPAGTAAHPTSPYYYANLPR